MKMTKHTKTILMGTTLMAMLLPAVAQNSTPPSQPAPPTTQTSPLPVPSSPGPETANQVQQRKWVQRDRIANGVDSGQLTAGEASTLEKKESQLNQEDRDMKAEDNGHLTAADRAALQQQQNQLSNQIYKDKRNAAVQNTDPKREVGKRAENQQDRIGQGLNNGQLNAGQAAHLEQREAAINQEVKTDRQANGGYLTKQEKAQVNQQQNHVSKQIYKDKHSRPSAK
jgi:hypothetical protein